jgi:alpha-amylase
MPAVCFYFQIHQPFRIKRFHSSQIGNQSNYFDDEKNEFILNKVAMKSYLKTNSLLHEMILHWNGRFKISFAITGVALEAMERFAPEVLKSFQNLVATGNVEIIAETYYHSLAALYDEDEFKQQVFLHQVAMKKYFNYQPKVFRNTELIYNDRIGTLIHDLGFKGILTEGADDIIGWKSPNYVYHHPSNDLRILTKNYRLSDDIAFRFSNRSWAEYPLRAERFAEWVHAISGNGDTLNLFMDYETFGEHQWEDTGIFEFLKALPEKILARNDWEFLTPSQVIDKFPARSALPYWRNVSWADLERDTSAWNGNSMQTQALQAIYSLAKKIKEKNDPTTFRTWRYLLTSDHFYYMCTKWFSDGDVHAYFSPFKSPYQAFLSYMNVLEDLNLMFKDNQTYKDMLNFE